MGFGRVQDLNGLKLAQCFECGCVIVDDDEGANRALHLQASHAPSRTVVRDAH